MSWWISSSASRARRWADGMTSRSPRECEVATATTHDSAVCSAGSHGLPWKTGSSEPIAGLRASSAHRAGSPRGPGMPSSRDATAALDAVEALVRSAPVVITHNDTGLVDEEAAYLAFHRTRFLETLTRVVAAVPAGAAVLDVGGQFLHVALAL